MQEVTHRIILTRTIVLLIDPHKDTEDISVALLAVTDTVTDIPRIRNHLRMGR